MAHGSEKADVDGMAEGRPSSGVKFATSSMSLSMLVAIVDDLVLTAT